MDIGPPDDEAMDGLIGCGRSARKSKAKVSELVFWDGPPTLIVLIGQPRGRCTDVFGGRARSCQEARASIAGAVGAWSLVAAAQRASIIVGVGVVRGWRCVREAASHADTYALMREASAFYPKRGEQRFVDHCVMASATLIPPGSGGQHDLC